MKEQSKDSSEENIIYTLTREEMKEIMIQDLINGSIDNLSYGKETL